jgi:hypothetical protein
MAQRHAIPNRTTELDKLRPTIIVERQRATDADRAARTRLRDVEAALIRERAAEADLARRAMTTETRLAALLDTLDKLHADLAETEEQAAEAERDFEELAEPASARAALDRAREQCCGTTYEASVRACEPIRSGSVRVQLVCVTHSWREPDSNHQSLPVTSALASPWRTRGDAGSGFGMPYLVGGTAGSNPISSSAESR